MTVSTSYFDSWKKSWAGRCCYLIRTDTLFALSAVFYILAGLGAFTVLELKPSPSSHLAWLPVITLASWLTGVILSVLFLHYSERSVPRRRKLKVAVVSIVVIELGSFLTVAYLEERGFGCLFAAIFLAMGLLPAARSPRGAPHPHFDEFHPIRFLCRMMEAGLIFGIVTLVGCFLWVVVSCLPFGCPVGLKAFFNQASTLIECLLLLAFCPLYTLSRLMDDQAATEQPNGLFPAFLAFAVVPLILAAMLNVWARLLMAGWKAMEAPFLLTAGVSVLLISLFPLLPEALLEPRTTASKVLKVFKKIAPYFMLPPLAEILCLLVAHYRSNFALTSNELAVFYASLGCLGLFLLWARKPSLDGRTFILCSVGVGCIAFFVPERWAANDRAEAVFLSTLRKYHALEGETIHQIDFSEKLTPQETKTFQKATLALVNRKPSSKRLSEKIIQDICQRQKDIEVQKLQTALPPVQENVEKPIWARNPKDGSANGQKKSESSEQNVPPRIQKEVRKIIRAGEAKTPQADAERLEKLLLQTSPLSPEDKKFIKTHPAEVRNWRAQRFLRIMNFFTCKGSSYHTVDWYLYPGDEKIGPFFRPASTQ